MTEAEANKLFHECISTARRELDRDYAHVPGVYRTLAEQTAHRSAWLLLESLKAMGAFK